MIKRTTTIETVTILNIILFLYTGVAKIMDYAVFREQLAVSPILGSVAQPVALLLPWLEFAIVLMLVVPRWRMKGLWACLILMTVFTAYIIILFSISTEMPCSCGGVIDLLSWQQHLVFNGVFILFDAIAIRLLRREKKYLANGWREINEIKISHG